MIAILFGSFRGTPKMIGTSRVHATESIYFCTLQFLIHIIVLRSPPGNICKSYDIMDVEI